VKSVILSLSGPELSEAERDLFASANPFGYILFKRNCADKVQLEKLTDDLRTISGPDCPILIDQEGGRVQRLGAPEWEKYPAANTLQSEDDVYEVNSRIAKDLAEAGINVNCAPVLDVLFPDTHEAIGDRAFSENPQEVFYKGKKVCEAYLEAEITPVIKHLPGHGRAVSDSHHDLPVVDTLHEELSQSDFLPFREMCKADLASRLWGMAAHVIYSALDSDYPASVSEKCTRLIRDEIGFQGLLLSDDLSMQALKAYGDVADRACKTLEAGCDIALYCAGQRDEMEKICAVVPDLRQESIERYERSQHHQRLPGSRLAQNL